MNGFIYLHRKMLEWEWADEPHTVALFVKLLLLASWQEKNWHGLKIKAGQVVTSYPSLKKQTGMSIQNLRTSLAHLKSTGELTVKKTNKFSIITIQKWGKYQQGNRQPNSQLTPSEEYKNKEQKSNDKKMLKIEPDETDITITEDGEVIKGSSPKKSPELSIKNFNAVRTYFADGYQKAHGTRPLAQSGEYPNFVRVRKQYDGKQIKEIIDFYIQSEKAKSHPSFNACMSGHTISLWEKQEYNNQQKYR